MPKLKYDAGFISLVLQRSLYTTFNTFDQDKINSRIMVFAADSDLKNFYLVTNKTSKKISELAKNSYANLLILGPSNKLDDSSETQVHGTAKLFSKFDSLEVKVGLELLSEKSSMISTLKDTGSLGDFCIIQIKTSEINFRVYKDILQNIPKTTLNF
ncbi:MAG: pyridoxamine 5'-phosphate oxidase family protein [bacterium]